MLNSNDPSGQYSQNNPSSASSPSNQNNFKSPSPQPDLSTQNSQSHRKRKMGCLGVLILILIFGMMVISCVCSSGMGLLRSHSPSIFFQGDFPFGGLGVFAFMGVVFVLSFVILRMTQARSLSKWARGFFVLPASVAFGAGIFFWSIFINPNIGMTRIRFLRTSTVNITTGDTVYFRNLANGVTQILCVGRDQHCQSGNNDPSQLDDGLVIQPDQTVSVVFSGEGTYEITSKITPHMNITISVSKPRRLRSK